MHFFTRGKVRGFEECKPGRGVHSNWSARVVILIMPDLRKTSPLPVSNLPAGEETRQEWKLARRPRLFTSLFGDVSEKTECKQSVPQKCCLCHCIFNGMNHRMRGRAYHRAHCLNRRSAKIAIAPPGTPGDFGRSLRSPKIARSAAGFWRIN